ncbi:MAG: mechanosensitive ion channel family protein [Halobacteriota archaeon]
MTFLEELFTDLGLGADIAGTLASIVLFVVAIIAVYVVGRAVLLPLVDRALRGRQLDEHARRPLLKVSWAVLLLVGILVAFAVAGWGDALRSLATIAAAGTLAIGFAMQNVIRNFVAGVFIFTDKPFRIGDWIEWNDHVGIVEDISFRVTRVRTFNNELLTVPNGDLTDAVVKNPVAKGTLRLQVPFGIGYGDDIAEATEIILEEARDHPEILEEPEPSVRLVELGDSSVGLEARIWIDQPSRSDFIKTRSEYTTAVKNRFDEVGIEIPFPQRDLSGAVDIAGERASRTD